MQSKAQSFQWGRKLVDERHPQFLLAPLLAWCVWLLLSVTKLTREQVFTADLCLRCAGFGRRAHWWSPRACFACKCSHLASPSPFRRGGPEGMPRLDGVVWKRTFPDFCGESVRAQEMQFFCHGGSRDNSCTRHHPASRAIGSKAMASL